MSILGHRVSTDALLLALASVVVIVFLYRKQAGAGVAPAAGVDQAGNGLAFAPLPTDTAIASTPPAAAPPSVPGPGAGQIGPLVGAGFAPPKGSTLANDYQGVVYTQIQSAGGLQAAIAGGQSVYYEPAAGAFAPVDPRIASLITESGTPYTNTPTYLRAQ